MDVLQILRDYNITHQTDGPKTTQGFVNIHCPFCVGRKNFHLGIELTGKVAHCWRCGTHPTRKVLTKILNLPDTQVRALSKQYGTQSRTTEVKIKIRRKEHRLPSDTGPLTTRHNRYLIQRNFDPQYIAKQWDILGTGPMSLLDGIDYKHRLLAPVEWNGKRVSFQTRDITNKHPAKYMACPEERELIKHKHVLYGKQTEWKDTGIIVEGITDVWRLGPLSCATFGIEYTIRQVREIVKHFKRVIILFDDETQAQAQAQKLKADLQFRGQQAVIETITGDPGDLAPNIAKELINKIYNLR